MPSIYDENPNYSSNTSLTKWWMEEIAPRWFDFEDVNIYSTGTLGYINAIMAEATMDGQNAVASVRREFYPSIAQFRSSLYTMAITAEVTIPMVLAAHANIFVIMKEADIIEKGEMQTNGMVRFVLDNSLIAYVGDSPFLLDYPIIILARKTGTKWNYTTHFEMNHTSFVSIVTNKYIQNKAITQNGERLLIMQVPMTQCTKEISQQTVTRNSILETVTLDFIFDGNLAGFDVFYRENDNSSVQQLIVQMDGSTPAATPFCNYKFENDSTLRLIFPYNNIFMPAFNSQIEVHIYTSLGASAAFDVYNGDVNFFIDSEDYPYNNDCLVIGTVNGGTTGGADATDLEAFRREIIEANSTNKTYVTENDLQILFNNRVASSTNKVNFYKLRDDYKNRIFGAFMLMKDSEELIIPVNTLDWDVKKDSFSVFYEESQRLVMNAGKSFRYTAEDSFNISVDDTINLSDNLDIYETGAQEDWLFTNPFLVCATLNPTVVGCFLNSIDEYAPLTYNTVNDMSHMQFNAGNIHIQRNAVLGENYYKLSITVFPSSELDYNEMISYVDTTDSANFIRASRNGRVISKRMDDQGDVYMTVRYSNNSEESFLISSRVYKDLDTGEFKYVTGYDTELDIGDTFVMDNIIFTKKVIDLGKLRLMCLFDNMNVTISDYIPFVIEAYNLETDQYTLCAYIKTDDYVTLERQVFISGNIYLRDGDTRISEIQVPIEDFKIKPLIFFKDDTTNYVHSYNSYDYVSKYTFTNSYVLNDDATIVLLKSLGYIRNTMIFTPGDTDASDYRILIKGMPMIKTNWIKQPENLYTFINILQSNYDFIDSIFYQLEETFNIDIKVYNTYGKSKYYQVGIRDEFQPLDSVGVVFSFGVKLSALSNQETFRDKFIIYLRNYIEQINNATDLNTSIYIINMLGEIKDEFSDIEYLEYYGMNEYDYDAQKIIGPTNDEIKSFGNSSYVPEFINIKTFQMDGITYPQINIHFL